MTVITISRTFGSGGDEIAEMVCNALGFRLFNKQLLAEAALEVGLAADEAVDYSEESYKIRNFFERLFGRSQPVAQVSRWTEGKAGGRYKEELKFEEAEALSLVQNAVKAAYRTGAIVILGRGGQVILKDQPGVLHARVEAPLEDRLLRVRQSSLLAGRAFSDSFEARRAVQDLVAMRDATSADYLKSYYNVDWADPGLYHLILNTGKLTNEQAARVIIEAARILTPQPA